MPEYIINAITAKVEGKFSGGYIAITCAGTQVFPLLYLLSQVKGEAREYIWTREDIPIIILDRRPKWAILGRPKTHVAVNLLIRRIG